MVASKTLAASAVVAALSAPALVDAHGYLMVPKASIPTSGDPTKYAATIYGPNALKPPAGMKFSDTIDRNLAAFTQAYKKAGWSSLPSFIKKYAPSAGSCGLSKLDPKNPQTVGNYVQWSSFAQSHVGPCEVWCDNTRVFHNDNCAGAYKSSPAKLPINQSKCANAKQLTFYWLALHEVNWQVYINCVALKGKELRSMDDEDDEESSTNDAIAADADTEDRANDEDCDEEYPEPADNSTSKNEDCDEEYPEPADNKAASAAKDEDCDEEYPEPADNSKPADGEVGGDADTGASAPKDEDCDEEYPEPADNSKPADDDCDEEYPEPSDEGNNSGNSNKGGSNNNNSNNNAGGKDEYAGGDANEYAGGDADTAAGNDDAVAGDADTATGDASKPADDDCDEEYPEPADNASKPADEDCDEEYPEPVDNGSVAGDADTSKGSEDCDEEYPEPAASSKGSEDCDEEYPEPSDTPSVTPAARSIDGGAEDVKGAGGYNFDSLKGQYSPGKAETEQY